MDVQNKLIRADKDIENPYIFVSYAHKDMTAVQDILGKLRGNGYRFWYDEGIGSGTDWARSLAERISNATQFMLILSPNAIASKHVKDEIYYALQKEKSMCIVYLEPTTLPDDLLLQIGRIQAVRYFWRDGDSFYNSLIESINAETRKPLEDDTSNEHVRLNEDYVIRGRVGEGGLGIVYSAEHKRTGACVAIKQARVTGSISGELIQEVFSNERAVLKRLEFCPFVPKMVDYFREEGDIYLIENFLHGESLESKAGILDEDAVVGLAKQALIILRYFEKNRIIHKDIKPDNFRVDENGVLMLIDFGCSRIVRGAMDEKELACGTKGYAAPEQLECYREGVFTDFSTDIYGLGRTLMFLLIGGSKQFVSMRDVDGPEVSLRYYNKAVSPMLEEIINKMSAQSQADRYQRVDEVLEALENYKQVSPVDKRQLYLRADQREREYAQRVQDKAEYIKSLNIQFSQRQALEWTVITDAGDEIGSNRVVTEIIAWESPK